MGDNNKPALTVDELMARARLRPEPAGARMTGPDYIEVVFSGVRAMLDAHAAAAKHAFGSSRSFHFLNDLSRLVEAVSHGDYDTARQKLETVIVSWEAVLRERRDADGTEG